MNDELHEVMTLAEVAEYLHCSRHSLWRMLKRGEIHAMKIGSDYRFLRPYLDTWMEQRRIKPGGPPPPV